MEIQREMLCFLIDDFLMDDFRLLALWLALGSAPIQAAKSPRWKSAQLPIWATEAGLASSKRQFFLSFRFHLLVSNTRAVCDFILSLANVGEREGPRAPTCLLLRRSFKPSS